jgi:hypothetical protein
MLPPPPAPNLCAAYCLFTLLTQHKKTPPILPQTKLGLLSIITFCSRFSITKKLIALAKIFSSTKNKNSLQLILWFVSKPYVVGFLVFLSLVQEIEIRIIQVGETKKPQQ